MSVQFKNKVCLKTRRWWYSPLTANYYVTFRDVPDGFVGADFSWEWGSLVTRTVARKQIKNPRETRWWKSFISSRLGGMVRSGNHCKFRKISIFMPENINKDVHPRVPHAPPTAAFGMSSAVLGGSPRTCPSMASPAWALPAAAGRVDGVQHHAAWQARPWRSLHRRHLVLELPPRRAHLCDCAQVSKVTTFNCPWLTPNQSPASAPAATPPLWSYAAVTARTLPLWLAPLTRPPAPMLCLVCDMIAIHRCLSGM